MIWNISLSILSLISAIIALGSTIWALATKAFFDSLCSVSINNSPKHTLWTWLFAWSKVGELFDTLFIVHRKRRLPFLRHYHHSIVVFHGFFYVSSPYSNWMVSINALIHTIMYGHYALRALQIFQMIILVAVSLVTLIRRKVGHPASRTISETLSPLYIYWLLIYSRPWKWKARVKIAIGWETIKCALNFSERLQNFCLRSL